MKFDIEDMRQFADRHRGQHKQSGPHWSTILRYPILFDEYEKLVRENTALREQVRWIPVSEGLPDPTVNKVICLTHNGNMEFRKPSEIGEAVTHWRPLPTPPDTPEDWENTDEQA